MRGMRTGDEKRGVRGGGWERERQGGRERETGWERERDGVGEGMRQGGRERDRGEERELPLLDPTNRGLRSRNKTFC